MNGCLTGDLEISEDQCSSSSSLAGRSEWKLLQTAHGCEIPVGHLFDQLQHFLVESIVRTRSAHVKQAD